MIKLLLLFTLKKHLSWCFFILIITLSPNGTIEIECKKRDKRKVRFLNIFEKPPFIRGVVVIGQIILVKRKLRIFYSLFVSMFIVIKWFPEFLPEAKIIIPATLIISLTMSVILLVLIISLAVIRFSRLSRYHGAEHMVYNACSAGVDLTIENVRRMSRISDDCGTNLITILVVVLLLLMILFPYMPLLNLLLSLSLSYEIFRLQNNILSSLFMTFGGFVQKYIFTADPTDKQIEIAILALKSLDDYSTGKRGERKVEFNILRQVALCCEFHHQ
ncbi:DUF1385 domain-containing protein [Brevibacillus laterosporus]|uniref:DUF1385 domain-containing protein n=1 Tax=Brevibacillus laterosporus TaxID=1465 RepID=UPI00399C71E4